MGHYSKYSNFRQLSDILMENKEFIDSYVHIRYYSIIQLMHFLLIDVYDIYIDHDHIFNVKDIGIHNYLAREVFRNLSQKNKAIDLLKNFDDLKAKRIKADYSDKSIREDEASEISYKFTLIQEILEKEVK